MSWRYVVIGNFKTVDTSIEPDDVAEQFEHVSSEASRVDDDSFKIIVDEFISRRNTQGWGGVEVIHDFGDVLVVDQMTTQDYERFKLETQGMFSHAVVNQRHLDLFLFFERGGTVEEFEAQGGDLDEISGGFSRPEAAA